MKILKESSMTIVAGCYSPCKQGSSGGNKTVHPEYTEQIIIAGCHSPCQQGSSGGNKLVDKKAV